MNMAEATISGISRFGRVGAVSNCLASKEVGRRPLASGTAESARSGLARQAGVALDCPRPQALQRPPRMPARHCILLLVALLPACAAGSAPPVAYVDRDRLTPPERAAEDVGGGALSVVGTPFFALIKGVGCVASVVIATPVAIVLGLGERPDRALVRSELDRGVGANCGGSYVLGRG
jgi:hypothetical protein